MIRTWNEQLKLSHFAEQICTLRAWGSFLFKNLPRNTNGLYFVA